MPKSKYRKISNISSEDFSFQKPYSLPDRLKKKINNLYENLNETFISEIEIAITTYKFEEAVFRRAPTYTDIRIQFSILYSCVRVLHLLRSNSNNSNRSSSGNALCFKKSATMI